LDPSYHFCNFIGDEWTCSRRPEEQTSSISSLSPSRILPISASTPLELLRQRSLGHPYEGNFEDNHIDESQPEAEPESTLFTNITMQVRQDGPVGCDPNNPLVATCCGTQKENCQASDPNHQCHCKGILETNCYCIQPYYDGGNSIRPPRIFTIPGSILRSIIFTRFPISVSTTFGLFGQHSLTNLDEGDLEDNQDEDDIKLETEPQPSIFTNITMQVKRDSCAGTGPSNWTNTCCGPQEDNCCLDVHGNCSAYDLCEWKWENPYDCWCLLPSGCSSLQPPRLFTIPGHILRSTILTLSSSSLRLLGIFSIPQSLFRSTLLTLTNSIPALAKQPDDKRDLIPGRDDTDCGTGHVVCLAGYHCKNVGKVNYACSGTSSLRPPRIFFILSRPFQILLAVFGSMKTLA
jgi:hypothetical protein